MMKEALGLSKYIVMSTAIHTAMAVGLGWGHVSADHLGGISHTHLKANSIRVSSVTTVPSVFSGRSFQAKGQQPMNSRNHSSFSSDGSFGYHGVHISEDGIPETYTSELHEYLQHYFGEVFRDLNFHDSVEVAFHLEISVDGVVKNARVEPIREVSGLHLSRIASSVRELTRVPAPGDLARDGLSVVVPVAFR